MSVLIAKSNCNLHSTGDCKHMAHLHLRTKGPNDTISIILSKSLQMAVAGKSYFMHYINASLQTFFCELMDHLHVCLKVQMDAISIVISKSFEQ